MSRTYCVYRHTSPDGKVYIGMTSIRPTHRWWRGKGYKDNPLLTADVEKYGWDAFSHEIIRGGLTKEQAQAAEVALIRRHRSRDKARGYNIGKGGAYSPASYEGRKRISQANTGNRNKTSGTCAYKPIYKVDLTEEQIEKYIDANAQKRAVRCVETGEVFRSTREVERQLHISHSGVARCCNGTPRYKTHGGYHWEYVA